MDNETITIVKNGTTDKEQIEVAVEKVQSVKEWQGTIRDINNQIADYEHQINSFQEEIQKLNEIKAKIEPIIDAKIAEEIAKVEAPTEVIESEQHPLEVIEE